MALKPWESFGSGAVVAWADSLWIVARTHPNHLDLLSFDANNVSASPSLTWPYRKAHADEHGPQDRSPDPTRTVDTVLLVARSVREFISSRALAAFQR